MMILQQTRGALSSGDQLALDLPFAETKSLTARIGPTPTFTRASSGTFIGNNGLIQVAANNVARFDHDPVTLASRGLLIEEGRTNRITHSNNFSDVSWIKSNISIGSSTNLSPDGSNNATLLIAGSAPVSWMFKSALSPSGGTVTFFAKASGKRWAVVDASSGAGTAGVWFDLQNGVTGTIQTGYTASIDQFKNGFYRCRVTYPSSGAGNFVVIGVSDNNSSFVSTASGSNGIIVYGAQLEAGSFATSYIPTTTASVVRSADVCSITGEAFTSFCNQTEGTLSLKSTILASTAFMGGLSMQAADRFNCSVNIRKNNSTTLGTNIIRYYNNFSATFSFANSTYGAENKTIIAFKENDYASSSDGSDVLTDITGAFDTTNYPLNQMQIGIASGTRMFGWISEIKYYRRRLPNAKLQALTAP